MTIRQLRRKRIVRDGDTRVELSLDEVDVVSRSRVVDRFVELEAELVKGAEERLAGLAEVFAADPALAPASGSKLEAAMAAVRAGGRPHAPDDRTRMRRRDGGPAMPADRTDGRRDDRRGSGEASRPRPDRRPVAAAPRVHEHAEVTPSTSDVVSEAVEEAIPPIRASSSARRPACTADDHVAEAGRKVMRFHLARMLAREAGTRAGQRPGGAPRDARRDPPAARGLARLRRVVPAPAGRSATATACARSRRGSARSATSTSCSRRPTSTAPTCRSPSSARSSRSWPTGASTATTPGSCSSASSTRTATGAGSTTTATSSGPRAPSVVPVGPTQPHRVRDTTASRIWTAYEQVRGYEPVLRWADVETLHELRIAGKWLRYTLEFVREALGDDAAPLIARVTALQDHLGLMNDADVVGLDGPDVPRRARRRAVAARERGDRPLPRQPRARGRAAAPDDRRTVARRGRGHLPADARAGRRRACRAAAVVATRRRSAVARRSAPAVGEVGQPIAPVGPPCSTARIAPSRRPASETRIASAP